MARINIEGVSMHELINWPVEYFDELVLLDEPIIVRIGSAEVLGQFAVKDNILVVELAQIEGGGEGVLPAISRISKHIAGIKQLERIECIVHAIHCAKPNMKLRTHLEKTGFVISEVPGKGEAYYKEISVQ